MVVPLTYARLKRFALRSGVTPATVVQVTPRSVECSIRTESVVLDANWPPTAHRSVALPATSLRKSPWGLSAAGVASDQLVPFQCCICAKEVVPVGSTSPTAQTLVELTILTPTSSKTVPKAPLDRLAGKIVHPVPS